MFETQKIDSFFSGEQNLLDEEEKIYISRRTRVVRFLKLFLPCLTALLLGLGVILFDFEATKDNALILADDEKVYFEKFRMKNTVFEITEKDNQLSILKADVVEETEPGKKLYDLTNPDAITYDKGKVITLVSKTGVYNQNEQVLDLATDIVVNYNKQMEIKTNTATYNFATEYGFGNEKVTGSGEKGTFVADKFTFDKKKGIVTLIQNVFMKSGDMSLSTPKQAVMFLNDDKFEAINAVVKKGKDTLKADIVTAHFKDTNSFEIKKAYSSGHTEIYTEEKKAFSELGEYDADSKQVKLYNNVKIIDNSGYVATADNGIYDMQKETFTLAGNVKINKDTNTVTAPRAVYFQTEDEFRFYDDVKVIQADNVATADYGVYFVKKGIAELEGNVVITKNGNMVTGDKAISDFNTSKSRLIAKNGGRISGKLIENTLKNKKDK